MHSLQQLLAGQTLSAAQAQVESQIKQQPADADLRASFVQPLYLVGNWSRALTQLKTWCVLVFSGQSAPQMPGEGWDWTKQLLQALSADHRGNHVQAKAQRTAVFDATQLNHGQLTRQGESEPQRVEWLMDGDGRLGQVCELIANGHYSWLPFSVISKLRFQPPASVTDLGWRHTLAQDADDCYRLEVLTEWLLLTADEQQFSGHVQKSWLRAEADFPLLTLETLTFSAAESAS